MNKKDTSAEQKQDNGTRENEDRLLIDELKNKIAEITIGWQRTQADFINFKNQTVKERAQVANAAKANLIEEILPVLDNFALAAKHLPAKLEKDNWAEGVQQIEKQLETILSNSGLKKIETIGQQFNPEVHEAIEEVESEKPADEIVEEVTAGYTFGGLVVRPAKVKTSKGNYPKQ